MAIRIQLFRPVTSILLALLALLAIPAPAMAGSDKRESELNERLVKQGAEMTEPERRALKEAMENWFNGREESLKNLLDLVKSTDLDEKQSRWVSQVDVMRSRLQSAFGNALQNVREPTIQAYHFHMFTLKEEHEFVNALGKLHVAEARDTIIRTGRNLQTEDEDLQKKWDELKEQDRRLDELEQSAAKEMRELLADAVQKAADSRKTLLEKVASIPGKLEPLRKSGIAGAAVNALPEGVVKEILKAALAINESAAAGAKIWLTVNKSAIDRANRIAQLARTEQESIIRLFHSTRSEALTFVEKYGSLTARVALRSAEDELRSAASSCATSGQKDDLLAFTDEAVRALGSDMSATESAMEKLMRDQEGRFLGSSVSDTTVEDLAETRYWEDESRAVHEVARKIEEMLNGWRNDASGLYINSLSGLTDAEKEELQKQIRSRVEDLVKVMEDAASLLDEDKLAEPLDRRNLKDAIKR
ncbi:MAG: hypothetical protein AB7K09_10995 [Planctomycetota bacterium]